MLVELSVVEQRYHAVMEVLSAGAPVTEVAERYGVSRKTVHAWILRYRKEGLPGLTDRSHRPHRHPWQLSADVEAQVCQLRRSHPRWGPRRLVYELGRAGLDPVPSLSTVYRVLTRHQLVCAAVRKRRRQDYRRWQRPAPMQLWQMDIMGSVMLADGRECKLISGIDDHSRYCVIATVVSRATSRAVCAAFVAALESYGVPEEVLTDNGIQFTGKYLRPRPTEVLFDKICRHNGIGHLLTKIRSPTTTGKIERWHQSIQTDLLDDHGPFTDLHHAREVVEAWRVEYNTVRPHQALDMATPAARFRPVPVDQRASLPLWRPPELVVLAPPTPPSAEPSPVSPAHPLSPEHTVASPHPGAPEPRGHREAIEVDRVVPASGNLGVGGQQFWLGRPRAGQSVRLWMDTTTVHLSQHGQHLKTLPSRLTSLDLDRLRAQGARPAGLPPARPAAAYLASGAPIELYRTVNHSGTVSLGGRVVSVGAQWAGRRLTLRLEHDLAHVILNDALVRTLAFPLAAHHRVRLQGAYCAGPWPAVDRRPVRVQRRVSARGSTQIIGQRVQVGLRHAGRIVTLEVGETVLQVLDERDDLITTVPRTSSKEVKRHKAYGHTVRSTPG